MQFEYDPERLIEEVKKRPGIWNYYDASYRTMATRLELWNEVVTELLQPDIKVTKSEMRELVLQLQKKWKSIKDSFQKYTQNPNRTRRPYVYSKNLQFLLKNETSGENGGDEDGSNGSDEVPKKRKRPWKTKKRLSIKPDQAYSEEDDNGHDHDDYAEQSTSGTFNDDAEDNVPTFLKKTEEFAFANVETRSIEGEDCDKLFLLSLLPHLKTIPEDSRLNVKMELLQVLRNANYKCGRITTLSDLIT